MEGVTDLPFRDSARHGRGHRGLRWSPPTCPLNTAKSRHQLDHRATRAAHRADPGYGPGNICRSGAHKYRLLPQVIDISCGCPAKKVRQLPAGSALMRDETLIGGTLGAVVAAAAATARRSLGWDHQRNAWESPASPRRSASRTSPYGRARRLFAGKQRRAGPLVAQSGPAALHPVFVNGDIGCAARALEALNKRRRGMMIVRTAQGGPGSSGKSARDLPEKSARRLRSKRSVVSCFRTSRPFTRSTAR